jgi:hypothetical protein
VSALVWRLWPQSKIFAEEGLDDIAQSYQTSLNNGHLLPHTIEQDIAESAFALTPELWLNQAEYNQYLDEAGKNIPDPLPDDLEPEVSQHG